VSARFDVPSHHDVTLIIRALRIAARLPLPSLDDADRARAQALSDEIDQAMYRERRTGRARTRRSG
jgi:hypothetical protein